MPDYIRYYKATIPPFLLHERPACEVVELLKSKGLGRMDAGGGFSFRVYQVDKRGEKYLLAERTESREVEEMLGKLVESGQVCLMILRDFGPGYVDLRRSPDWLDQMVEEPCWDECDEYAEDPADLVRNVPSLILREELARRKSEES